MEPTHLRLAEIGLQVAGQYGFALAGGYAVQAHGILHRPSEDVDLFTAWERRADFAAAVDAVVQAYTEYGYTVEITQQFETFARLAVVEPSEPGHSYKVELAANWRALPPVQMDIGPVLHPDDVVAGKMSALYTRAEPRDSSTSTPRSPQGAIPANACANSPNRPTPASTAESSPTSSPCWTATPTGDSPSTAPTPTISQLYEPASPTGVSDCSTKIHSPRSRKLMARQWAYPAIVDWRMRPQATHGGRPPTVGSGARAPRRNGEDPPVRAFREQRAPRSERVKGIEPSLSAWEPYRLPSPGV